VAFNIGGFGCGAQPPNLNVTEKKIFQNLAQVV
jgi:hypothetical protein